MMSRNAIVCAACASIKRTSSIFDPKDGITKFSVTMSSNNVDSRFSLHGFNRLSAITNTIISIHISQRFKKANASTAKTNPLRRFARAYKNRDMESRSRASLLTQRRLVVVVGLSNNKGTNAPKEIEQVLLSSKIEVANTA